MRSVLKFGGFTLGGLALLSLAGCGDPAMPPSTQNSPPAIVRPAAAPLTRSETLKDGQYPLQQAKFDDATGEYTVLLMNTPSGMSPNLVTKDLAMARLTDEQVKAGEKSYVKVESGKPSMYLTPDFRLEYIHSVTEVKPNPNTGVRETVVVRQEPSFWGPFAGSLAGQAIGSMLFRPQYYVPPMYQPGPGGLMGHGGYGGSYGGAVDSYRNRYNEPPQVERNRTNFRTTGQLRNAPSATTPRSGSFESRDRSTGSGFGSSTLRSNGRRYNPSTGGFGSQRSGSGSRSGGFGSMRRR
jgi:hypothetical protein